MSALAWLCRLRRSASRPEPSASTTRHLRRRLAAALLALPLFALAAGVQAQQVLVSNIGQADGGTVTFEHDHAQFFLAGGNAGGYRLESVDIEFASATRSSAFDSTVLAVEIRRLVGTNDPGALVGRLTNPKGTSFSADRLIRFTAPASGIDLDRFGQYFLVLDVAGQRDADFAQIRTATDTSPGVDNFAISRDARLSRPAADNTGITTNWQDNAQTLKIRLNGTAKAPPGLEFSTTHLSWDESKGCGEFEYYDPSGNKIEKREGESAQQLRERARKVTAPWQTGMLSAPGASMELPAMPTDGEEYPEYEVRLTTQPSETVKVNIHDPNDLIWWGNNGHRTLNRVLVGRDRRASNGRGGAGKPTLTFTPSNWDQWQTVKAKVACTDHFPDAVPLKHVVQHEQGVFGTDGAKRRVNYGEVDQSWTVWVSVNDETPPVTIEAESEVSGLPPEGKTITLAEGETKEFKIRIGEAMLPIGSSGSVSVHLFTEPINNVLRATRRHGQPFADGTLHDTMTFTNSSREQWVRLTAVGLGDTRLVISAERDFTWAHETRRHWSPEWPVTVEHAGICGRTEAVRDEIVRMIPGVRHCRDVTDTQLAGISGDVHSNPLNLYNKGLSSLKAGDFDGLTSLKRLRMDRNSLTTLPAGIFDNLAGLISLDLDDNQLTTLRPSVFDSLTNLRTLYLNDNNLSSLPDGVFRNNLALATHWLLDNPGAPFRPTANAGTDQTVGTGEQVTLSGTATGPWASSDLAWRWRQVDGPNSTTLVQGGVKKDGATASFTAPAAPTVMHFRLAAIPKVLLETRTTSGDGTSILSRRRGILDGFAWVTITVGAGQGSPQQNEDAQPASVETPSCVSAELMADAQLAATETWRSPDHVERWSRVLAAFGEESAYSNHPMTIAEAQAQADRGLKRWAPVAPVLECLANSPQETPQQEEEEEVTPTTPELSLSPGAAITEGGDASFTITADPAPTTDITIAYSVTETGDFLDAPGAGARTTTLAAGTTSVALSVATVDDAADEADGSVSVTLGTGTGYTVATGKGSTAVAVRDNDEPVVSITAGPGVTEGTSAAFTITADPVPAAPLAVTLTITQSGDMAASGQTGARTVTIPAAGTATFSVATEDDAADEPDGSVTATIDTGTGYSIGNPAAATVTVTDNDATTPSTGPTISIADATMNENQYNGWFTVTLSEKVAWPVHVYYATRDSNPVSAVAGEDYLAWKRSWRLRARFRPGQTETKIHVPLYNDSHDEDPETFEMVLFDAGVNGPPGVTVSIADGVAVGTITNSDPMPAAFLSRFGRTVAQQALDGIESRITAPRTPGTAATIAGQALALGSASHVAEGLQGQDLQARALLETDPFDKTGPEPLSMTAREALLASSFTTTGETASGSVAIWGRGARDSFDGQEGSFSLDGTATTAMLGADYARDRWLIGLALLQSSADGSYADTDVTPRPEGQACPPGEAGQTPCGEAIREGDGKVEASLTAVLPYASMQVSERLRFWGALGHGTGEVTLKPETGGTLTADTSWQMAAAGLRAELAALGSGTLHLTSDALWSRTRSDKTHELAASDATVTRLRAGMEASWQIGLASGATLTPGLEVGARHDGGDAEQGAGIELGASLAWSDPASGFAMDLSARKLIAHDDDDFEENGLAASFIFDPDPDSDRGLSVSLRQDSGEATGGVDALFMPEALERQEGGGTSHTAEAAYGLPAMAGRFTIAPHARLRMDDHARDYTLGWRLTPERGAPDLSLGLEATRREHGTAAPVHGVGVGLTLRW